MQNLAKKSKMLNSKCFFALGFSQVSHLTFVKRLKKGQHFGNPFLSVHILCVKWVYGGANPYGLGLLEKSCRSDCVLETGVIILCYCNVSCSVSSVKPANNSTFSALIFLKRHSCPGVSRCLFRQAGFDIPIKKNIYGSLDEKIFFREKDFPSA